MTFLLNICIRIFYIQQNVIFELLTYRIYNIIISSQKSKLFLNKK